MSLQGFDDIMVKRRATSGLKEPIKNPQRTVEQHRAAAEQIRAAKLRSAAIDKVASQGDIEINPGESLRVTMQKLAAGAGAERVPRARPRVGGPALQDPDDRRDARFAMRMHPHLLEVLTKLARERGLKVSQLMEDLAIEWVNKQSGGGPVVDAIGRSRMRKCLSCGHNFLSAGPHNRVCNHCKSADHD